VIGVIFSSIFHPALRLNRLRGLGLEAVDEALQMGAAGVLLLGLGGLQHGAAFGALAGELVVGAALPIGQLAVVEMQDALDGAVQKAAVVADDDDGMGIFRR
jgi:hypothetical protein